MFICCLLVLLLMLNLLDMWLPVKEMYLCNLIIFKTISFDFINSYCFRGGVSHFLQLNLVLLYRRGGSVAYSPNEHWNLMVLLFLSMFPNNLSQLWSFLYSLPSEICNQYLTLSTCKILFFLWAYKSERTLRN